MSSFTVLFAGRPSAYFMNAVRVEGRKPKMLTPGDALGQRGEIAWKFYHANAILNDNWIANIKCAATSL